MSVMRLIEQSFRENIRLHENAQRLLTHKLEEAIQVSCQSLKAGGTLFWAGNGGSAADAQHMAAELVGRFKKERKPIRSIALGANTSLVTAIGNDYSYDLIFCKELEALSKKGDVLVAISTSGNSKNILALAQLARSLGVFVIALTGETGGLLAAECDILLSVPSRETARIQEVHFLLEHTLCEAIEDILCAD